MKYLPLLLLISACSSPNPKHIEDPFGHKHETCIKNVLDSAHCEKIKDPNKAYDCEIISEDRAIKGCYKLEHAQ